MCLLQHTKSKILNSSLIWKSPLPNNHFLVTNSRKCEVNHSRVPSWGRTQTGRERVIALLGRSVWPMLGHNLQTSLLGSAYCKPGLFQGNAFQFPQVWAVLWTMILPRQEISTTKARHWFTFQDAPMDANKPSFLYSIFPPCPPDTPALLLSSSTCLNIP